MLTEETEKLMLLDRLYREQFHRLFLYAKASLRKSDLAEEAVQDTFRIACGKLDQVFGSGNPPGWLMNTLKYVIKNMEHSHSRLSFYLKSILQYDETRFGKPDEYNIELLYRGLIAEADFNLLKCVVLERYTYLEAANRFGLTPEACKKRMQRIKKELRAKLEPDTL